LIQNLVKASSTHLAHVRYEFNLDFLKYGPSRSSHILGLAQPLIGSTWNVG